MKLNKKKVIYICFMLCFMFYLIFSNSIVIKLTGKISPSRLEDIKQLKVTANAQAWIDFVNIPDNFTQDFSCNGWIFAVTQKDNNTKNVSAVFKGKNVPYNYIISSVDLWHKVNLSKKFPDLKNEKNSGFVFDMSALNMKKGIYELILYDVENEETKAMAYTGISVIKDSKGFRQYIPGEIAQLNGNDAILKSNLYASLNIFDNKDDKFLLYGWAGIKGESLLFQNVYLKITDENGVEKYYDSNRISHEGAVKYLKDDNFFYSGFQSYVSKESFVPNTTYTIDVILNIDDKWFYNSLGDYYCESSSVVKKIKK